jgi:hypothetical protein
MLFSNRAARLIRVAAATAYITARNNLLFGASLVESGLFWGGIEIAAIDGRPQSSFERNLDDEKRSMLSNARATR